MVYFGNSTLSASLRKQAFTLSGSYINSRTGKWQQWQWFIISGFFCIANQIFTPLACNAELIDRYRHFSDCLTPEDGTDSCSKTWVYKLLLYRYLYNLSLYWTTNYSTASTHKRTSASQLHHKWTISRGKT